MGRLGRTAHRLLLLFVLKPGVITRRWPWLFTTFGVLGRLAAGGLRRHALINPDRAEPKWP